jgi:hypothetical protein
MIYIKYIFDEREIWAYILLASYKVPDILAPPSPHYFFLDSFSQKSPITNFTEIFPVADQLIHEDGRADRRTKVTKLRGAFRDYTTAPKTTFQSFVDVLILCFRIAFWLSFRKKYVGYSY